MPTNKELKVRLNNLKEELIASQKTIFTEIEYVYKLDLSQLTKIIDSILDDPVVEPPVVTPPTPTVIQPYAPVIEATGGNIATTPSLWNLKNRSYANQPAISVSSEGAHLNSTGPQNIVFEDSVLSNPRGSAAIVDGGRVILFSGCRLTGELYAVWGTGVQNIIAEDSEFNVLYADPNNDQATFRLENAENIIIRNCDFSNTKRHCLRFHGRCRNILIDNCRFHGGGIMMGNQEGDDIDQLIIANCVIDSVQPADLDLSRGVGRNVKLLNNVNRRPTNTWSGFETYINGAGVTRGWIVEGNRVERY